MPSLGDALELPVCAAVATGERATPMPVPRIWSEGEETRGRFRSLVPGLLRSESGGTAVGLCSTLSGEGTTTMTAGLACALAEGGHRVVVIDGRPDGKGSAAGEPNAAGTVAAPASESLLPLVEFLSTSASGTAMDPVPLRALAADARRRARVVLIDLPPLRESSQALGLSGCLDAIYLVVEAGRERREAIARSVESLTRAGLHVGGLILNKRRRPIPGFLYRRL
jgi:Mrp family chromosome partitioning ATPase